MSRKQATDYDRVIQKQRDLIYATRNQLLDGGEIETEKILEIARENIRGFLNQERNVDSHVLNRYILDNISYRLDEAILGMQTDDKSDIATQLLERVAQGLKEQEEKLGSRQYMNEFMRVAILNAVDAAWVEQVDYLQQLQAAVSGRATAQRNLLFEYQNDAFEAFEKMKTTVYRNIVRNILLSDVYVDEGFRLHILFP